MTLYGLGNCDTCRRARRHLQAGGVDVTFHDLRKDGIDWARLERWADAVGWQALVNRRSTIWRALPEATRTGLDRAAALAQLAEHPTLIKRPVLEHAGGVLVGYRQDDYEALA